MAYNPDIPQPPNIPAQSQSQFLENFQQLNSQFAKDHFAFNAALNNGWHKQVTLIKDEGSTTVLSDQIRFINGPNNQLKLVRFGSPSPIPLSASAEPTAATNGLTWLPGGLLLQWGYTDNIPSGTDLVVPFLTGFSGAPFSIVVTPQSKASSNNRYGYVYETSFTSPSNCSFTLRVPSSSYDAKFYWMAIGPAVP